METSRQDNKCSDCGETFSSRSGMLKHMRKFHGAQHLETKINCPLCWDNGMVNFATHELLTRHFVETHGINVIESSFVFKMKDEFENWMQINRIDKRYIKRRNVQRNDHTCTYYYCNRSDLHGFKSTSKVRQSKAKGSIKIHGVCPSRLIVKIFEGTVEVYYCETHVGHQEELRVGRAAEARFVSASTSTEQEETEKKNVFKECVTEYLQEKAGTSDNIDFEEQSKIQAEQFKLKTNLIELLPANQRVQLYKKMSSLIDEELNVKATLEKKRKMEQQSYYLLTKKSKQ